MESGLLTSEEKLVWNEENKLKFMMCLLGHKVVGIEKHFHMAIIHEEFSELVKQDVCVDELWKHLKSLYDLSLLEDHQPNPPWENSNEIDFRISSTNSLLPSSKSTTTEAQGDATKKTSLTQKTNRKRLRNLTSHLHMSKRRK